MLSQIASALLRASCVAVLVMSPSLLLPSVAAETAQIVVVIALLLAALVFMEYVGRYPSIVDFRFAPPFNRLRFAAVAVTVVTLSVVMRAKTDPGALSVALAQLCAMLGRVLDFPFSPVRLMVQLVPAGLEPELRADLRAAAGLAQAVAVALVLTFVALLRLRNWPMRGRAFNVWVNLPLFDPTRGGNVVDRLRRDGGVNILLGILLPFMIPLAAGAAPGLLDPRALSDPQTLIWGVVAWAILPAGMLMRGLALWRVAGLIDARRKLLDAAPAAAQGLY